MGLGFQGPGLRHRRWESWGRCVELLELMIWPLSDVPAGLATMKGAHGSTEASTLNKFASTMVTECSGVEFGAGEAAGQAGKIIRLKLR